MAHSQWNTGSCAWEGNPQAQLQNMHHIQNSQNMHNMHLNGYPMVPGPPFYSSPMVPGGAGYQPGPVLGAPFHAGPSFPRHFSQGLYPSDQFQYTHELPLPYRMPMNQAPEQQAAKDTAEDFPNRPTMGQSDRQQIEVESERNYRSSNSRRVPPRTQYHIKPPRVPRAVPLTDEALAYKDVPPSPLRSQRAHRMQSPTYVVRRVPEHSPPRASTRPMKVIHTVQRHDDSDSSSVSVSESSRHARRGPRGIDEQPKERAKLIRIDKFAQRDRHGRLREINRPGERFGEPIRPFHGDDSIQSSITLNRHFDENGNIRYHTLWVDSPSFTTLLRDVGKYELHTLNETGMYGFMEPFVDIYYRRDALREFLNQVDRASLSQYPSLNDKVACAEVILDQLENDFAITTRNFDLFRSADPPATISFPNLWMIYKPGSLVFAQLEGQPPFAVMIDSIKYSKSVYDVEASGPPSHEPLILYAWFLDFYKVNGLYNGKFGRRSYRAVIESFEGRCLISKLKYVPEAFFKDEETKNRLKKSGRRFWQLSGPSYREVPRLDKLGQRTLERERIMVDPGTYPDTLEVKSHNYDDGIDGASNVAVAYGVSGGDGPPAEDVSRSWLNEYNVIDPSSEPTELMLLLCPPTVEAFSLRGKNWDTYRVADLEPVQFRENAWSRLVIDQEYKDVVQAMVNSHLRQSDRFDDLIPGKGGGVVILLHGPPGVGKTLTAESVAENSHKPLWMATAGDLGTDPARLESKLSNIFELATRWDAILLLDEADVFLQDRDYENLTRNALVSIFLRTLEYFKGIMFLTSNRVGAFDQAFQSRIHITLGIPEFNETVRKEVWTIFLDDLGQKRRDGSDPLLTSEECKALRRDVLHSWSQELLNGRQIRNCVRSALALAQDKGEKVSAKHFNIVIQLGNTFTNYMNKLQKLESDELAQVKGDRLAKMRSLVVLSGQPNGHCMTHEEADG